MSMKYNKEFKRLLQTDEVLCSLGPEASSLLLSYDLWKQRIKRPTIHFELNWRMFLNKECLSIDEAIFGKPSCWRCFMARRNLADHEKLKICELNKKTLYKICKKVDKRLLKGESQLARAFNANANTKFTYRFLGGKELTKLRIAVAKGVNGDWDCPICFETLDCTNSVVTECGHAFCRACVDHMWQTNKKQATTCPMCRHCIAGK